jgi:hypothetical protein
MTVGSVILNGSVTVVTFLWCHSVPSFQSFSIRSK